MTIVLAEIELLLIAPILIWIAFGDLRRAQASNAAGAVLFAAFLISALNMDGAEVILRMAGALAILGCGWLAGLARTVQPAGLRLFAAVGLFVPPGALPVFAVLCFVGLCLASLATALLNRNQQEQPRPAPVAAGIALAGIALPLALYAGVF